MNVVTFEDLYQILGRMTPEMRKNPVSLCDFQDDIDKDDPTFTLHHIHMVMSLEDLPEHLFDALEEHFEDGNGEIDDRPIFFSFIGSNHEKFYSVMEDA